jgi:hypothetical protein
MRRSVTTLFGAGSRPRSDAAMAATAASSAMRAPTEPVWVGFDISRTARR